MEYADFLKTHVKVNITNMVMELKPFSWEDEVTHSKWYEDLYEQVVDPTLDEWQQEHRTPDEFWVVSPSLAKELRKKDQLLTDHFGFWVWGREITLDSPQPFPFSLVITRLPSQLESEVLTQIYKESLRS